MVMFFLHESKPISIIFSIYLFQKRTFEYKWNRFNRLAAVPITQQCEKVLEESRRSSLSRENYFFFGTLDVARYLSG